MLCKKSSTKSYKQSCHWIFQKVFLCGILLFASYLVQKLRKRKLCNSKIYIWMKKYQENTVEICSECCCDDKSCELSSFEKSEQFTEVETRAFIFEESENFKNYSPPPPNFGLQNEPRCELYRLTTFKSFPSGILADCSILAKAGFYYTGSGDLVKCFSCSTVTGALTSSNPFDPEMHCMDCAMLLPNNNENIALEQDYFEQDSNFYDDTDFMHSSSSESCCHTTQSDSIGHSQYEIPSSSRNSTSQQSHRIFLQSLNLQLESDRLKTFQNWPSHLFKPSPRDLAHSGFYFLGTSDRTQCFSCLGILKDWSSNDDVALQHLRFFPSCQMALHRDNRNQPDPTYLQTRSQQQFVLSEEQKRDLAQLFQCNFPVNSNMSNWQHRLDTYISWSFTRVPALKLAEAGYYSLGVSDQTKCFYCGGMLRNWEFNDDPWDQHAKWFPTCEFLLRNKGPDFVYSVTSRFPNLVRPPVRDIGKDVPPPLHLRVYDNEPESHAANENVTSTSAQQTSTRNVDESLHQEVVKTVIDMGFDAILVNNVVARHMEATGRLYDKASVLLDDVVEAENNQNIIENSESTSSSVEEQNLLTTTTNETNPEVNLEFEMELLLRERRCKVCLDSIANVILLPCRHMCCCQRCSESLRSCPVCRRKTEKKIQAFLS